MEFRGLCLVSNVAANPCDRRIDVSEAAAVFGSDKLVILGAPLNGGAQIIDIAPSTMSKGSTQLAVYFLAELKSEWLAPASRMRIRAAGLEAIGPFRTTSSTLIAVFKLYL
jgi:hypothetical protein